MPAVYADFPESEFEARYQRARILMVEHQLDGLLVTERLNYIYFSGHRSCQNPIDKIRPYVFILPLDGEPIMIFGAYEQAQVQQTVYVRDARPYGSLTGSVSFIAQALRDAGLEGGRIGCELGREQYLGISLLEFREIESVLPNAKFVDASSVFLTLRSIKSPSEIQYLRRSCQINVRAQLETARRIEVGMSEKDVAHILRTKLMEGGGEEITFLSVISPEPEYRGISPIPTDRKIRKNELLGFDVGISYRAYCSDIARSMYTGTPPEELLEFYAWMMDVRQACSDLLLEGSSPSDLVETCNGLLAARKQPTMGAGRIGHGVGLESTEYPSLGAFETIKFRKGMVFACNPNYVNRFGFVNAEDIWAVTDGRPDLLSDPVAERAPIIVG